MQHNGHLLRHRVFCYNRHTIATYYYPIATEILCYVRPSDSKKKWDPCVGPTYGAHFEGYLGTTCLYQMETRVSPTYRHLFVHLMFATFLLCNCNIYMCCCNIKYNFSTFYYISCNILLIKGNIIY